MYSYRSLLGTCLRGGGRGASARAKSQACSLIIRTHLYADIHNMNEINDYACLCLGGCERETHSIYEGSPYSSCQDVSLFGPSSYSQIVSHAVAGKHPCVRRNCPGEHLRQIKSEKSRTSYNRIEQNISQPNRVDQSRVKYNRSQAILAQVWPESMDQHVLTPWRRRGQDEYVPHAEEVRSPLDGIWLAHRSRTAVARIRGSSITWLEDNATSELESTGEQGVFRLHLNWDHLNRRVVVTARLVEVGRLEWSDGDVWDYAWPGDGGRDPIHDPDQALAVEDAEAAVQRAALCLTSVAAAAERRRWARHLLAQSPDSGLDPNNSNVPRDSWASPHGATALNWGEMPWPDI